MSRERRIRWGREAILVAALLMVVGCGSISGTVSSGGTPLEGVTVELSGAACATTKTTTDASGHYRFLWLAKGTYTVTPSMAGYSFTPGNQSVTLTKEMHVKDVNFDGSPGSATYSISGKTTYNGEPLAGVVIALSGDASLSAMTDADGNYRFADLPRGNYTVTPSMPGFGFTPASRRENLNANLTLDFSATPNTALAWGNNDRGQLGNGLITDSPLPVQVSNLNRVVSVAAGAEHSLALLDDGTVWAWGWGQGGQLGTGAFMTDPVTTPLQVSTAWGAGRRVVAVAAGAEHSLAILDDGTVWAWGRGGFGQLGNNRNDDFPFPAAVTVTWGTGRRAVAIAAGAEHSLALLNDGTVWGWGDNSYGQLGVDPPSVPGSTVPVQNPVLTGITAIACGGNHSMAIGNGGTVWTWGDNLRGQLGWVTAGSSSPTAGEVEGITGVASIAGGDYHTVAAGSDGTVWTWGLNDRGQLGVNPNATPASITPVRVSSLSGVTVTAVAAGGNHSVVAGSDGTVRTWGQNTEGQLGSGTTGSYDFNPAPVSGLTNIIKVAAGSSHTVVVKSP